MISTLILSCSLLLAPAEKGTKVHILAYHAFLQRNNQYCFSLDELRRQCMLLQKRGYQFITFDDFRRGRVTGRGNILLTVDDGNRSVYDAYYQVLKPLAIRPLLAIYPNIIGKKKYALTWEQLRRLKHDGCTIAAHGYYHLHLNERLYRRDPVSFKREIYKSRSLLEKKLGGTVDIFVYPFGGRFARTVELVKKAGYRYAFTVESGSVDPGALADPLQVPRYMLTRHNVTALLGTLKKSSQTKYIAVLKKLTGGFDASSGGGYGPMVVLPVKKPEPAEIRHVHEEGYKIDLKWPLEPVLSYHKKETRYLYHVVTVSSDEDADLALNEKRETPPGLYVSAVYAGSDENGPRGFARRVKSFYFKTSIEHGAVYPAFYNRFRSRVYEIERYIRKKFTSKSK